MDIHVLQHEPHETGGHINEWAERHGHRLVVTGPGRELLPDPRNVQMLIVLGGALNTDDVDEHPWLIDEKRFLGNIIAGETPVLGICLGSQLLAEALGAKVGPNPVPEIGWHKIDFDRDNLERAGLLHLTLPGHCLEWHSQTFDIPKNGLKLASSQYCENQAFIANGRHIGLQFHPEWTRDIVQAVARNEPAEPNGANIQSIGQILAANLSETKPFLFGLLDHLVSIVESELS